MKNKVQCSQNVIESAKIVCSFFDHQHKEINYLKGHNTNHAIISEVIVCYQRNLVIFNGFQSII